jgi:Lon protease-like protein
MAPTAERFPLFPLGLVLLPEEVVPLHIFEERYKLMIGECLEQEREFGILWLADGGLREVGCGARVERVLQRFDDGRMNIVVRGTQPFHLERRIDDMPYPAGDVRFLEDEAEEPVGDDARERYADLVERVTDERPTPEALGELTAYGMAATVELDPDVKQELLELRSERRRLERVAQLFVETLDGIEAAERAAERARGNGRIPG